MKSYNMCKKIKLFSSDLNLSTIKTIRNNSKYLVTEISTLS